MKPNLGYADRGIRLVGGLALLAWGYWSENYFGLLGFVLIATASIKWCPLYVPFKISTYRKGRREIS